MTPNSIYEFDGQETSLGECWMCTLEPFPQLSRYRIVTRSSRRGIQVVPRNTCQQTSWPHSQNPNRIPSPAMILLRSEVNRRRCKSAALLEKPRQSKG